MKTSACALLLLLNLEVFAQNSHPPRLIQARGAGSANAGRPASAAKGEAASQAAQVNPRPYLTNAVCVFDSDQGWTVRFTIQGGVTDVSYGIYRASFLAESATVWELLGEGYAGSAFVFSQQPDHQAFYALGDLATGPQASSSVIQSPIPAGVQSMSDSAQLANLPASWLARHFGANWQNNPAARADADPDGDGVSNLEEHRRGRNPLARAVADSRDRTKLRVYTLLK